MASYTKLWQGILPAVPRSSRCQVSKELFNFVRADMNTAPEAPADNLAENTVLNVKRREMFCFWFGYMATIGVHHTSSMQACQIFSFFFLGGFFFFYICQTPCLTLHLHRLKNVTRVSFAVGVSGSRKRVKCHFFGCGHILRTGNLTGSGETDKDELCSDKSGNHKCVINNTGGNTDTCFSPCHCAVSRCPLPPLAPPASSVVTASYGNPGECGFTAAWRNSGIQRTVLLWVGREISNRSGEIIVWLFFTFHPIELDCSNFNIADRLSPPVRCTWTQPMMRKNE